MNWLGRDQVLAILSKPQNLSHRPFDGASIGDIDFSEHIFETPVDFRGAQFVGLVTFERAVFRKQVHFAGTHFHQIAWFENARFEERALFTSATFRQDAHFRFSRFVDRAYFWRARFHGDADFMKMLVYPGKDFEPDFIYPGETNFSWAWFMKKARFTRAHFHGPVYFWRTLFFSETLFDEVMFKTKVFFNGTKTEVQTSRFEFPNPRVLDFLQQQNLLRADNEEYIVCPTTREKRPVFFLFNGMSSDEQLRERLSGFNAADLSADDTAQLMETWQRGAREMFHSPELVSFRGAVCEQPTEARFIDVNIDINVDATKELSVMPTISSELSTTNQHLYIDFAIITAIEVERKAVCKAFGIGDDRRVKTESGIYWRGTLDDFYEIVIVQCRDQANIDMALTTLRTLDEWTPGAALMVGIAAAAREDKPRLGDVVVASSIYYYERGKMTPEGKKPEPQMYPSDSYLWANVETLPDWGSQILVQRPNGSGERPEIHRGVVASGEKVIADAAVRDEIAAAHRKIMAIEMEGYGFSKAVWDRFNPVRHLVIRGIVDKASNEKDDQWHSYAAAAAASYAKHFLIDRPLPPRNRSRQRICYYGICSQP